MRFFWVDSTLGKTWDDRKKVITTALESGASAIVVEKDDIERAKKLGNFKIALRDHSEEGAITIVPGHEKVPGDLNGSPEMAKIRSLKKAGAKTAGYVEIHSKAHERLAALEAREADHVIVVGKDWTVIPLENLIAELQGLDVKVMAGVKTHEEAKLAFETLEVGVDGVMLSTTDLNEIKQVAEITRKSSASIKLSPAKIMTLKQVSMGDRVCIDTASLLNLGEGMLIGSQSQGLFLVHSETLETEYVASRPFRVNAGAVHAYVLTPDMKTKYLSELKAGDEVLAVDYKGNTRPVIVGRVKIEKRPLMLVEVESEGKIYKTLLQNAETITLLDKKGKPVSISKLKIGDEIMIHTKESARHFGMEIKETIIEK